MYRMNRKKFQDISKTCRKQAKALYRRVWKKLKPLCKKTVRAVSKWSKHITKVYVVPAAVTLHLYVAKRPHEHLRRRWQWYDRWHTWDYHKHVHLAIAGVYLVVIGGIVLGAYQKAAAASDTFDDWNFSNAIDFIFDDGIETNGSSARLKAQNYTTDANTSALFHFDELSGTSAADSSANSNTGTVANGSFNAGNLNNGLSLNGTTANVSVADSASLSLSQNNTLEAWTKFSNTFAAGSHDRKQGVIDKGSYKLYYDQETGKVTYELANTSGNSWSQQAGNDIKNSWDANGKLAVNDQIAIDGDIYVGLGNVVGDAEVWKWDGSTWNMVGGAGKNNSWAGQTFENVVSMTKDGTKLYAGLGSNAGDAEVWSCETSTGCATWSKIGGDGINGSWAVNTFEEVESMSVMGGNLYAGLGTTANDARVYRWNGSSWTWVGGFGIGAPYNAFTTNYEAVYSMSNNGTDLYVGFGNTAGDADVWKLSGNTWTQVGGDAVNTSWAAATFEAVLSMHYFNGSMYAGLGTSAGDGEVWRCNATASCTSWTKIGGDTVNSSWDSTNYEGVYSFTDDGTNVYAGLGASAGDNEVYQWNGAAWTKIGGDALNGSFTNTHVYVNSLVYDGSTLYTGLVGTGRNAEIWTYEGGAWAQIGGGYVNRSWGYFNLQNVESMTVSGDYLYAGTGNTVAGNAQVWRFDGNNWQIIGGQGLNNSWAANNYEDVMSMVSYGGNLYVGLGTSANDAEVWRWDGSTWTKIGGDSVNSGWTTNYEEVYTLATYGGNLYAGVGNTANDAEVWRWNGSSWAKIGGDSLNGGWTANFERISSLAVYDGNLYAGLGASTTDAEVWRWNGSAWTKIGGDGVSSSWNTNYEQVESMIPYNGKLYVGLGNSTGDAEVWEYSGTAWTQIGGDDLNGSWIDGQYEQVRTMAVYNGKLYAGLGASAGDGEVWEYDNGSWAKIAGGGVNTSWPANTIETVTSFSVYRGKLYTGLGNTANADAAVWSYGSNGFLQSTAVAQDTSWHHIAATYNGTTMKLFVDGALDAQATVSLAIPDTSQPLLLGSTYGAAEAGWGQGYFEGMLDEVRISDIARSSMTTKPYTSAAQTITLANAVRTYGIWHWDEFMSDDTLNGGSINYQFSDDDGATWKFWNGSAWQVASTLNQANDEATASSNIATFPVTFSGLKWKAILKGDGDQRVTLNSVGTMATSDYAVPATNATSITANKTQGGAAIAENAWTNGGSPYFGWTAGDDAASGIKGYCAYLGSDNTADPVTTKGLLGTSPVATGSHCQFIQNNTDLNLAVSNLLSTALSTSSAPYYLRLKAIDNAGNVSTTSEQFSFRFDNTAPTNPGFITAPSGFVNSKEVTLSWPTSGGSVPADANSGVAGLQYRIGSGGTWYGDSHSGTGDINDVLSNDGSYTTQATPDYANLNDGVNNVYFRTWDQAGNVTNTYATAAIKLNTAGAPSEPQNLSASPSTNSTNSFAFSWDAPTTFVGDENTLTYCYSINTVPSVGNCTFTSAGVTSLGASAYATQPGSNTFYVVAKDESGNVSYDSYTSTTFNANTPAPGIALNVDVVDVSIKTTNNWRLALTWDVPTYDGAGVTNYKIYRSTNNVNFTLAGSSSSTTYIDAGLNQQEYYYRVKACDSTNNCGADSNVGHEKPTGKFTVPADLVAEPTITNVTTKRARIAWSTDRASDSKIAIGTQSGKYEASEIADSRQVSAHQIDLANLSAGTTYYFVAKWTDEDGNTGLSQEYTFTTSPAPQLKEITTPTVSLTGAVVRFTSQNATKVGVYYGGSDSFGGLETINTSLAESTYNVALDGLSDGTKYFYKLVSYDSEGTSYDSSIFSFTTPARPKISNLKFQPIAGEPTSTQQVTWTTNVPSSSSITYGKVGTSGTEINDANMVADHSVIINDLEDDSEYFLVAESRDLAGNVALSDRQVFRTALDTRAPKISNISVESSIRGSGAEARGQVVVSWRTDEPATSQVWYGEGSGITTFNNKTAEDNALSFEHIVIVSDLPTSKVYSLQPVSYDKSRNVGKGEPQSAIIGRASDSVLTVVLNTLQGLFGL